MKKRKKQGFWHKALSLLAAFSILFSLAPISSEAASNIPKDVHIYNGHAYKVYNKSMTWKKAKKYCEDLGGHLVTVTSEKEKTYINKLLKNAKSNCYWIGLSYSSKKKNWVWVTGETFNYKNWTKNEPNNFNQQGEAYVHLFGKAWNGGSAPKHVGEWNDVGNDGAGYANSFYELKNFGFICEWELTSPKKPTITSISKKTGLIKGKTSTNVTVYIKIGNATFTGKSNSKGVYSIKTQKIKSGTTIKIYAKNQYKLKSKTLTTQVW